MSRAVPAQTKRVDLSLESTGLDDDARQARSTVRLVLAAFALGMAMFVSATVTELVQAALQQINAAFHTSQIDWVQTASLLSGAVTILAQGKLGDLYGKRLLLLVDCAAAAVGGVVCASTHSFAVLLVGRVIQGLAVGTPIQIYGLVRDIFPRRRIPLVMAAIMAAFPLAPLVNILGAWLTTQFSANALFWTLAIQGAVTALLVWCAVPETPLRTREPIDWPGIGMISAAIFALVYGLNEVSVPARGWTSAWTIGFLTLGAVVATIWVLYLRSADQNLIHRQVLLAKSFRRLLGVTLPTGVILVMCTAMVLLIGQTPAVLGPGLTTGYGLGLSSLAAGGYLLIGGAISLPALGVAAWYARAHGLRLVIAAGLVLLVGGVAVMTYAVHGVPGYVGASVIFYAGDGVLFVALPLLLMQSLPAHSMGIGAGIFSVLSALGTGLGTQLLTVTTAHNVLVTDPTSGAVIANRHGLEVMMLITLAAAVASLLMAASLPRAGRSLGGALPHAAPTVDPASGATPARPATSVPEPRDRIPLGRW